MCQTANQALKEDNSCVLFRLLLFCFYEFSFLPKKKREYEFFTCTISDIEYEICQGKKLNQKT